jgi:DNA gyrase subunit B
MYIGDTEETGYHHCLWEIVDNSIDEHMAGYGKNIRITIFFEDGKTWAKVADEGRGIPVGIHKQMGISAATVAVTELHGGGKFNNEGENAAYKMSGGLHGVGASCVNALSENFILQIDRDGYRWEQSFSCGIPEQALAQKHPSSITGTTIIFSLDRSIFKNEDGSPITFSDEKIIEVLKNRSFLNPGLRIDYSNTITGIEKTFYAESFVEILAAISNNSSPIVLPDQAFQEIYTPDNEPPLMIDVAFRYHEKRQSVLISYANGIVTKDGGTHESGFKSALLRVIKNYAEAKNFTKEPEAITASDVQEGLIAAISVRLISPKFSGQTKTKLTNQECTKALSQTVQKYLNKLFEEQPILAKAVVQKVLLSVKAREASERARETVEKKSSVLGGLPGKLATCQSNDPSECELFIVEGDSAGGSAKQGRDRRIQAVLPLKGKPLNVQKQEGLDKILKSEEIKNIIQVLGCGTGDHFQLEKLRYYKIILMTDADVDGSHINILLLTLFHKLVPQLLENGHIYLATPPLYRVAEGKKPPLWIQNDEALKIFTEKSTTKNLSIQRFKGLGEMNPEQLWETTMNPETRTLKKVMYAPGQATEKVFEDLMGDVVEPRRQFIEKNATYATLDI